MEMWITSDVHANLKHFTKATNSLNKIEIAVLQAIINENKNIYPFLEDHYRSLYVINREMTGVGFYTNLWYQEEPNDTNLKINTCLSSTKTLLFDWFNFPINYELAIDNGKMLFLEFVTNCSEAITIDPADISFRLE